MTMNRIETKQKPAIDIDVRAKKLQEFWPATATSWDVLVDFYNLPSDIKGLKVLDVCAGESDLTAVLAQRGADSFALDMMYDDFANLHQRVLRHYRMVSRDKNEFLTIGSDLKLMDELENKNHMKRFRNSFENQRERYIAGSAHNIPFEDDSFDYVLSFNGVLGVTQEDMVLLTKSMDESIRVLKPGGQLQFGPMKQGSALELGRGYVRDIIKILGRKEELHVSVEDVMVNYSPGKRLTVQKQV